MSRGAPIGWRPALRDPAAITAIISQNGNGYQAGFVESFWKTVWDYQHEQTPEPARYPVAYFPTADIRPEVLVDEHRTTHHQDLGDTAWYAIEAGDQQAGHAAWRHTAPPEHADLLRDRVAFAWRAMDGFYEEDERIVGHAADPYHRIDIRHTSRHLVVRDGDRTIADTTRPLALYESGFAPRWYLPRQDIDHSALTPADGQTFCPYKGLASYYDIGEHRRAAWSYREAWPEVGPIGDLVSFEPQKIDVYLDGTKLELEPGQTVIPHGIDRGLDPAEILDHDRVSGTPAAPTRPSAGISSSRPG